MPHPQVPVGQTQGGAPGEVGPGSESSDRGGDDQRERESLLRRSRKMIERREEMKLRAETERAVRDYEDAKRQRVDAQERAKPRAERAQNETKRRLTDAALLLPDMVFGGSSFAGQSWGAGPISFNMGRTEEKQSEQGRDAGKWTRAGHAVAISLSADRITKSGLTWGGAVSVSLHTFSDESSNVEHSPSYAQGSVHVALSPRLGLLLPLGDEVYIWPRASVKLAFATGRSAMNGEERSESSGHLGATVDCGLLFALTKHLFISITPTVYFSLSESSSKGNTADFDRGSQSVGFGASAGLGLAL